MPCYHPLVGYRSKFVNPSGKRSIVFNSRDALERDVTINVPCGQCIGCRLKYSAHWAVRCMHESQMHAENMFLTLTFSPEHLPPDGSISVRDCQLFMKRFRKAIEPSRVRFAYCGEYGEKTNRPHYHFLVFGHEFSDRTYWASRNGLPVFRSKTLERLWPFGNSEIGSLTFDSAAYVARYMLKKHKGKAELPERYWHIDYSTGELVNVRSLEFFKTSRRPGIGKTWFDKFHRDVYPSDEVIVDGRRVTPPKFYDTQFEILDPYEMEAIRDRRLLRARRSASDNVPCRLSVKEQVTLAKISHLPRSVE